MARSLVSSSVLADVIAVAARIDQPVQMPQIVAGLVFAMPGKLDRKAAAHRRCCRRARSPQPDARSAQVAQPFNDLLLDFVAGSSVGCHACSRSVQVVDEAIDQNIRVQAAGLGGEIADHPMAQNGFGQGAMSSVVT